MPQLTAADQPASTQSPGTIAELTLGQQQSIVGRVWAQRRSSTQVEALLVCFFCAVLLCLFYFEVVFENRTFLPIGVPAEVMGPAPPWQFSGVVRQNPYRLDAGGSAWQLEPWARIVADSYSNRLLPLWNPHQFFGTPLAGDAQPGAFDVLRLPAMLSDTAWGWDLYYLSQSALCLVLTYVFARSVGFRVEAALLAAAAYAFSGFMFIRGNMHYAEIYHLLPAILWGTERIVRGAVRSGVVIVAVAVAMTVYVGMPEVTLLAFLYAASFGAFRVGWLAIARRSAWFAVHRGLLLAISWVGGLGLAAPMVAPLIEYVGQSYSIHPPERGLGLLYLPLRTLSYIGVPFINGLPTQPLTGSASIMPLDDYSGAAVLMLAIVGTVALPYLGSLRATATFALASALLWGAKLFGVPGIAQLGGLPLLVQTLTYIFGTPLLSFSLVLLAGAGVHALAQRLVSVRAATVAGFVFIAYIALAVRLNWQTLLTAGVQHLFGTVGLALVAGVGIWLCLVVSRRISASTAGVMVSVIAIGELLVLAPHNVYSDRADSLTRPPFVGWLQQQVGAAQPFRVFSNDGLLYPDYAGAFGLDDPRVIDGLWPLRTWQFVKTFLSPTVSDRYVGGFGHPELPTALFGNKWLNLSNVRFIIRPPGAGPADATMAEDIVAANYPPNDALHASEFAIDGKRKEVLVQRTPGDVSFALHPNAAQPTLTFSVARDPTGPASAVEFLAAIDDGQRHIAYTQALAPQDRGWVDGTIDLRPYIGHDVHLVLQARTPYGSSVSAGWGDLHLAPLVDPTQFTPVYSGEVSIWENTQAAPRAFLVDQVRSVTSSSDAIAVMQDPGFDPKRDAVVEAPVATSSDTTRVSPQTDPGRALITKYESQQVRIAVESPSSELLVLTDTYFPGWTATIDGAAAAILPTDLAFRGVMVPSGSHEVTFSYAPGTFFLGGALAFGAVALLGLVVWRSRRVEAGGAGMIAGNPALDPSELFGQAIGRLWQRAVAYSRSHLAEFAVGYVGVLLAVSAATTMVACYLGLRIVWQLDEGEPLIFGLATRVVAGQPLYQSIDRQPFVQAHYTPLYYYAIALMQLFFPPSFEPGRALSLAAGLIASMVVGAVTVALTRQRWTGILALLMFIGLAFPGSPLPFLGLERVDMLGIALSLACVAVLVRGTHRRHLVIAGLLAAAALMTKQSLFAAAAAGTLWLLTIDRGKAVAFGVTTAVGVLIPGLLLEWSSGGAFWDNIGPANPDPTALPFAAYLFREFVVIQGIALLVAIAFVITTRAWRDRQLRLIALYLVCAALPVAGIAKVGANHNYWIELAGVTSILATLAVWHGLAKHRVESRGFVSVLPILLLGTQLTLLVPLRFIPERSDTIVPQSWTLQTKLLDELLSRNQPFGQLLDDLRTEPGPMLAESLDAAVLSGHPVQFEPFAFSMLEYQRRWNSAPLVDDICSGRIKLLVLSYPIESDIHPVGLVEFPMWPNSVLAALRSVMKWDSERAERWLYRPIPSPDANTIAACRAAAVAAR